MSDHTDLRIETPGGDIVAYLAPNFEVTPVVDDDLVVRNRARGDPAIVRDLRRITEQVTVQGVFEHSSNLPSAHRNDLQSVFETTSEVTPRDQVNRIKSYMYTQGGPFYFFDGNDEYRIQDQSNIDWANGLFPAVSIAQFRPPNEAGAPRHEYVIKMAVGLENP